MGFAEKKVALLQIVADADEELTGLLIDVAQQHSNNESKFSHEDLKRFHASRTEYLKNPQNSFSLEDAHAYIRSLKK
jgi:hypothetical protein